MPYIPEHDRKLLDPHIETLAEEIARIVRLYDTPTSMPGLLNYSLTRLIQLIPRKMMEKRVTDEELRYWIMPMLYGTLMDVAWEHKIRVNQPYEILQRKKNGDVFDTPVNTSYSKHGESDE